MDEPSSSSTTAPTSSLLLIPERAATKRLAGSLIPHIDVYSERAFLPRYQLYANPLWLMDRSRLSETFALFTGNYRDTIKLCIVRFRSDEELFGRGYDADDVSASMAILNRMFGQFEADGLKPQDTHLGTILVGSPGLLTGSSTADPSAVSSSSATSTPPPIAVPGGDYDAMRSKLTVNLNLRNLGCAERSVLSFRPPSEATKLRFYHRFGIGAGVAVVDIDFVVIELVRLIQKSLFLLNLYSKDNLDGLVCNSTLRAVRKFKRRFSKDSASEPLVEDPVFETPDDGVQDDTDDPMTICDPATLAHILFTIHATKYKLTNLGYHATRNPLVDMDGFCRQIKHFQKANSLPVTRVLDAATFDRIEKLTGPRAVPVQPVVTAVETLRSKLEDITGLPVGQKKDELYDSDEIAGIIVGSGKGGGTAASGEANAGAQGQSNAATQKIVFGEGYAGVIDSYLRMVVRQSQKEKEAAEKEKEKGERKPGRKERKKRGSRRGSKWDTEAAKAEPDKTKGSSNPTTPTTPSRSLPPPLPRRHAPTDPNEHHEVTHHRVHHRPGRLFQGIRKSVQRGLVLTTKTSQHNHPRHEPTTPLFQSPVHEEPQRALGTRKSAPSLYNVAVSSPRTPVNLLATPTSAIGKRSFEIDFERGRDSDNGSVVTGRSGGIRRARSLDVGSLRSAGVSVRRRMSEEDMRGREDEIIVSEDEDELSMVEGEEDEESEGSEILEDEVEVEEDGEFDDVMIEDEATGGEIRMSPKKGGSAAEPSPTAPIRTTTNTSGGLFDSEFGKRSLSPYALTLSSAGDEADEVRSEPSTTLGGSENARRAITRQVRGFGYLPREIRARVEELHDKLQAFETDFARVVAALEERVEERPANEAVVKGKVGEVSREVEEWSSVSEDDVKIQRTKGVKFPGRWEDEDDDVDSRESRELATLRQNLGARGGISSITQALPRGIRSTEAELLAALDERSALSRRARGLLEAARERQREVVERGIVGLEMRLERSVYAVTVLEEKVREAGEGADGMLVRIGKVEAKLGARRGSGGEVVVEQLKKVEVDGTASEVKPEVKMDEVKVAEKAGGRGSSGDGEGGGWWWWWPWGASKANEAGKEPRKEHLASSNPPNPK
ncbi:hypothetical protein BJ742DRAFT_745780 [Cladochytrium replicatum]|nr:hypothetical protein BJ742DRAFT_745780 [Cladochytrium replicatum]